ncbi:helix-turn-helix transcriptional regulator [Cohnella silvisoli]|uniref:AraC family transcriptional regulator n=1 Tax=Cohnella silvisoli TaxID=2873699 RepID=A0ABV1KLB8_9BACL|nr:AraC family transcriptional regulator [Cohnella silvisoli]MCD9020749.1 AraC family transcriptional regulator [Cohnella silvisoli]
MLIRSYGNGILADGSSTGGGVHPYYELLYITSGSAQIQWVDHVYNAAAPSLYLFPTNTPHELRKLSGQCRFIFVELEVPNPNCFPALSTVRHWNALQSLLDQRRQPAKYIFDSLSYLQSLLLSDRVENKRIVTGIAVRVIETILLLIGQNPALSGNALPENEELAIKAGAASEIVESVKHYLEANYKEQLTLENISAAIHLNGSYIIRLFHLHAGMTPFQYLNELRMNAALTYLSTTPMLVSKIAEAVGFQSIHYFSRLFKQKYDVSPTKWRELHNTATIGQ